MSDGVKELEGHPIVFEDLKKNYDGLFLLDITGVDRGEGHPERFSIVYHFVDLENSDRIRVKLAHKENEPLKSIAHLWKAAAWQEWELSDMLGIPVEGAPDYRLFVHDEFKGFPLRKDYCPQEDNRMRGESSPHFPILNGDGLEDPTVRGALARDKVPSAPGRQWRRFGPRLGPSQGAFAFWAELEGERLRRARPELGLVHRGIEKQLETTPYLMALPLVERLNHLASASHSSLWCRSIETLMGLQIPERAQALRMVFCELDRIVGHCSTIASMARQAGLEGLGRRFSSIRSRVNGLYRSAFGAPAFCQISIVGGLSKDIPPGWITECLDVVKVLDKELAAGQSFLERDRGWMDRTRVGRIKAVDALDWGYSGPVLRASGVNYDVRKAFPYYFYSDVEFEIPLGVNGDCYDRHLVRAHEIEQSLKIVGQVLDNLPPGRIALADRRLCPPSKEDIKNNGSALMDHMLLYSQGIRPSQGECFVSAEFASGEQGLYLLSSGGSSPERVKFRPGGLPLVQSFEEAAKDLPIEDALMVLASFGPVASEIDR